MNTDQFMAMLRPTLGPALEAAGFRLGGGGTLPGIPKARVWSRPSAHNAAGPWLIGPRHKWIGWSGTFTLELQVSRVPHPRPLEADNRLPLLLEHHEYDEFEAIQADMLTRVPPNDRDLMSGHVRAAATLGRDEAWFLFVTEDDLVRWTPVFARWLPGAFVKLGGDERDASEVRHALKPYAG